MKKIFAVVALVFAMVCSVATTANAQSISDDPQEAYYQCHDFIKMGDGFYQDGEFSSAKANYEQALMCNAKCPDRKFMSDRKINKRIDNCLFALSHGGKTKEAEETEKAAQVSETIGTVIAVGVIAGAIAGAASHNGPHHPVPHHDYHHGYGYPHHHHHF